MKAELKKVKIFRGSDFGGYDADLYINGKLVATVLEEGCGGEPLFSWLCDDGETLAQQWVASLPSKPREEVAAELRSFGVSEEDIAKDIARLPPEGEPAELETAVAALVDEWETNKKLRRFCRKETLFVLKGDAEGNFRTVKSPYSDKVKAFIVGKYGDKIIEIINERFKIES